MPPRSQANADRPLVYALDQVTTQRYPRPRQGDVEESKFVGVLLQPLALPGLLLGLEVQNGPFRGRFVVRRRTGPPLLHAVPDEGAEHDRELEPLGAMHGNHLHQVLVALQAKLGGLALRHFGHRADEPVEQPAAGQASPGLRLVQQVGQVEEVRQPPLSVRIPQEIRSAGRGVVRPGEQNLAHERGDASLSPQLSPLAGAVAPRFPGVVVVPEILDSGHLESEQVVRQGAAQPGGGIELRLVGAQAVEQPPEALRLGRLEHAVGSHLDAPGAELPESFRDQLALSAGANENGDVAGLEPLGAAVAGDCRSALAGEFQQTGDLERGLAGRLGLRRFLVPGLSFPVAGKEAKLQGGRMSEGGFFGPRSLIDRRFQAEFPRIVVWRRLGRSERDRAQEKRVRTSEQSVRRVDEFGCRAVVAGELEILGRRGPLAGFDVGEHVGAAKPVDRLLRIADDEQPSSRPDVVVRFRRRQAPMVGVGRFRGVDRPEDPCLKAVRVLELVDQSDREALPDALGEGAPVRAGEDPVEFHEQSVEAQASVVPARVLQAPADLGQEIASLAGQPDGACLTQVLQSIPEFRLGRRVTL